MSEDPRNAASEICRRWVVHLNDPSYVARHGRELVTPDFMRYDHRRITAQPPVDAQGFLDGLFRLEDVAGGWPTYELTKIIAVRGERLCVSHWVLHLGDSAEMEFVLVSQIDWACERPQVTHFFDPEDVDHALALLDQLHSEIA